MRSKGPSRRWAWLWPNMPQNSLPLATNEATCHRGDMVMSIFQRLFKVGQSEAHAIVDKLEDPIKLTQQGINDLKRDLQSAMAGLAEVKGVAIRLSKEAEDAKQQSSEYERKAMLLLQRGKE